MDYIIYHNRDLDGLASGAILLEVFEDKHPEVQVIGYHYGDKFDTRKMKSKNLVIADVSLPIEKMFSMARMSNSMIWIDHHESQLKELEAYAEENEDVSLRVTGADQSVRTIEIFEKGELLFTKYYSKRLSAAEVCWSIYWKTLSIDSMSIDTYSKAVGFLGQYDTWRNTPERQFINDRDWESETLPFQYGMRLCKDVFAVKRKLGKLSTWSSSENIESVISNGKAIIKYQDSINEKNMAFTFEAAFRIGKKKFLRGIAFNGGPFNSQTFKSKYNPEEHDFMMPFAFQGDRWNFSLYTTKDDVDILKVAEMYGGGGHKQACGFQVPANKVRFNSEGNILIEYEN